MKLALDRRGGGDALGILFVHGLAGDRDHWAAQLESFGRVRPVASVDLRGHGRSARAADGDYGVDACAADLEDTRRELGWDRLVLVGHSFGAAVAAAHAARFPGAVSGLLLVDPPGDLSRLPRREVEQVLDGLRPRTYPAYVEAWYLSLLSQARESVRRRVLRALAATPREVFVAAFRSTCEHDAVATLGRVRVPRQVVIQPRLHRGPTSLHRLVDDLPVREIDGVSHWLMMDAPARFDPLLRELVERVERGATPPAGGNAAPRRPDLAQ